jgi:hypothetical protein
MQHAHRPAGSGRAGDHRRGVHRHRAHTPAGASCPHQAGSSCRRPDRTGGGRWEGGHAGTSASRGRRQAAGGGSTGGYAACVRCAPSCRRLFPLARSGWMTPKKRGRRVRARQAGRGGGGGAAAGGKVRTEPRPPPPKPAPPKGRAYGALRIPPRPRPRPTIAILLDSSGADLWLSGHIVGPKMEIPLSSCTQPGQQLVSDAVARAQYLAQRAPARRGGRGRGVEQDACRDGRAPPGAAAAAAPARDAVALAAPQPRGSPGGLEQVCTAGDTATPHAVHLGSQRREWRARGAGDASAAAHTPASHARVRTHARSPARTHARTHVMHSSRRGRRAAGGHQRFSGAQCGFCAGIARQSLCVRRGARGAPGLATTFSAANTLTRPFVPHPCLLHWAGPACDHRVEFAPCNQPHESSRLGGTGRHAPLAGKRRERPALPKLHNAGALGLSDPAQQRQQICADALARWAAHAPTDQFAHAARRDFSQLAGQRGLAPCFRGRLSCLHVSASRRALVALLPFSAREGRTQLRRMGARRHQAVTYGGTPNNPSPQGLNGSPRVVERIASSMAQDADLLRLDSPNQPGGMLRGGDCSEENSVRTPQTCPTHCDFSVHLSQILTWYF